MGADLNWAGRNYNSYSVYSKSLFSERVQKISVNAGFTCPNRDGKKGYGGCIYCDNKTFNPEYCKPEISITDQLNRGISFFKEKYKTQKYLAYFQAYTNTYSQLDKLIELYEEALLHPSVIGLVIATRPDCLENELLDYLQKLKEKYYISVEIGIESTYNPTLAFINRGHTYEESSYAVKRIAEKGISTGAHMIIGLPGESRNIIISHAKKLSELPIKTLKLHQLQIIKDTKLAWYFKSRPELFINYSADDYIDLVIEFIEHLNPSIIIERFISESPLNMLISPRWGLKNFEFVDKMEKRLQQINTWQGRLY
ncbi:TIGR01212 family radical SAM protein [Bacteroidota bacterium]